jgi:hypothetical protein
LDDLPFLIPLQSVAFWGLLVAFTAAYGIQMLVFRYQFKGMHSIVLPVEFDNELFIWFRKISNSLKNGNRVQKLSLFSTNGKASSPGNSNPSL